MFYPTGVLKGASWLWLKIIIIIVSFKAKLIFKSFISPKKTTNLLVIIKTCGYIFKKNELFKIFFL